MSEREVELEAQILALTRELHQVRAEKKRAFFPGASPIPYAGRVHDAEEVVAAVKASLDFWLTLGPEGDAFEREFGAWLGVREVLLVNSGSSANLVAFSTLTSHELPNPVRPGDEVITCATGFPTTVNPILQAGCVPVFVDVDLTTGNLDVTQLEAALSPRTRAIMVAHTLGNPFDVDAVLAFCKAHGLFLIEDNCDALGSRYKGALTGTFGDLATSSFYPPHHMTMGEGGAVYMRKPKYRKIAESFRDWGRDCWCVSGKDDTCGKRFAWQWDDLPAGYDHKYVYKHLGYNLKPTDIQAAIGRAQLKKLDRFIEARRRNWSLLREWLAPLEAEFGFMEPTEGSEPSWFGFMVRLLDPDHDRLTRICRHLDSKRVGNRRIMGGNLVRQPAYKGTNHRVIGALPNADAMARGALFLGVYPGLDDEMLRAQAGAMLEASKL
jgi:CDP-6-deoxy-D-xylo-4-hexulose-3-dehydrase